MSKRENDSETCANVKVPKPNDQPNENELSTAVVRDQVTKPKIFKLHAVACDDLFEYLSLRDLCALGATCKRFNRLAGLYFQQNFGNDSTHLQIWDNDARVFSSSNSVDISVFSHFVQTVNIRCKRDAFQYVESNCSSLKKVVIVDRGEGLPIKEIDCLKDTLAKVEYVELFDHGQNHEASESLLKLCTNMKSLNLTYTCLSSNWFHQRHSMLEHVEWPHGSRNKVDDFQTFLEQNPNIYHLEINAEVMLQHEKGFMTTNAKLNELSVVCYYFGELKSLVTLLNDLYHREFYKNLSLSINNLKENDGDMLAKVCAVEKLSWDEVDEKFVWPVMVNLKKVNFDARENRDLEKLLINAVNLERIDAFEPKFDQIQLMMSRLANLKEIKAHYAKESGTIKILDILTMNKAREKLNGARKVIIYLHEWVYLPTKWKFGYQDFSLVEIRRIGSLPMEPKIKSSDGN